MVKRLFGLYVLVELAVVIALTFAIGLGWTVLLLVGTLGLGLAVAGSQVTRQLSRLRCGLAAPQTAASDGVLVALGTVLTVIPGLVSSLIGVLLLLPPVRVLARPAVTALVARGLGRVPLLVTTTGAFRHAEADYIDGEVIDVTEYPGDVVVEPPRLPPGPAR